MAANGAFLDLSNFFRNEGDVLSISRRIDISSLDTAFGTVEVKGEAKNTFGAVTINLDFTGMYKTVCDRCLEAVALAIKASVMTNITASEAKDDSLTIQDGIIDLQKTAYDALCLSIPTKILCKEDCNGLCYMCGTNLNIKKCECMQDDF